MALADTTASPNTTGDNPRLLDEGDAIKVDEALTDRPLTTAEAGFPDAVFARLSH